MNPHPTFIPTVATPLGAWQRPALSARRAHTAAAPAKRAVPRAAAPPVTTACEDAAPPSAGLRARLASRAAADTQLLARGARDTLAVALAACVLASGTLSGAPSAASPTTATPAPAVSVASHLQQLQQLQLLPRVAPALAEVPASAPAAVGVLDDAGVVDKSDEELFARAASSLESRLNVRVRFVLSRTLPFEGASLSDYASQLASEWALGPRDVLFVASPRLARAGVHVGDDADLQRLLPAETARSVAEETYGVPAGSERYGAAVLAVSNRLIPLLNGEADPGPPTQDDYEVAATYKTKEQTTNDRGKYIKIVGGVLVIAFVAPLVQTYWYVRDD